MKIGEFRNFPEIEGENLEIFAEIGGLCNMNH